VTTTLVLAAILVAALAGAVWYIARQARGRGKAEARLEASDEANEDVAEKARRDDRIAGDADLSGRLRRRFDSE